MRLLISLIIIILLASCGSKKPVIVARDVVVKDSVNVTSTFEPATETFTIPAESTGVSATIEELLEKPVTKTTGNITATLSRKRDQINCDCHTEELEQTIDWLKETIQYERSQTKTETITLPPVEIPYVPWYINILAWIGGISLALFGLSAAIKTFNPFSFITSK